MPFLLKSSKNVAAHHGRKNEFQNISFCTLSFGYKGSNISKEQEIWGGSLPGCGSFLQAMALKDVYLFV